MDITTFSKVRERVISKNRLKIQKAIEQQERIRFHTTSSTFNKKGFDFESMDYETIQSVLEAHTNVAGKDFFLWVKSILDSSKYPRFVQLFNLITSEVIGEAYLKLERVTEAQDRQIKSFFTNEDDELAFEDFRNVFLRDEDYFKKELFDDILKNQHNSICVIDVNEKGLPYKYIASLESIKSIKTKENGDIVFLELDADKDYESYLYCDEFYRRILVKDDLITVIEEYPHKIGYCPCHFVYNKNYEEYDNSIVKKHVFTDFLDTLDLILFQNAGIEYQKTYNFPIIEKPAKGCGSKNCKDGIVTTSENGVPVVKDCSRCKKNNMFIGAGTVINKEIIYTEEENLQFIPNTVSFTAPPIEGLQFNNNDLEYRKRNIIRSTTGYADKEQNSQAKNTLQITSYYENQLSVLEKFKQPLEQLHKFILETCARILYPNSYNFTICDYGRKFYLRTEGEILDEYNQAKSSNAPVSVLDSIMNDFVSQKYRNRPELITKIELMKRINKWSEHSIKDLSDFLNKNLLSLEDFELSINFNYYIERFEIENGSIVNYNENLNLSAKIKLIKLKLQDYVREELEHIRNGEGETGKSENEIKTGGEGFNQI